LKKHTILFLAANPCGTDRPALDREARAIQVELERSGYRDGFELETRWAAEPLDLLRELRRLRPTVVHFSGHGVQNGGREHQPGQPPRRDVVAGEPGLHGELQHGLLFHRAGGGAQVVSTEALERTIAAAGTSVKLVVLSACYSEAHAAALLAHVDCIVGMRGSIDDDAARSFAIGFYGGLGERESVAAAYAQGCAALGLEGLRDVDRPQLAVRDGVDASQLVLAAIPDHEVLAPGPRKEPGRSWRQRISLAATAASLLLATSLIVSAGARRATCRVPGVRSLCAAAGIGDLPTPAEQELWAAALEQDSEDGLQAYLQQYPTGVYAEEARSRLAGCWSEPTLGSVVDAPFKLVVLSARSLPTEDEARLDALRRSDQDVATVCKPLGETDLLLAKWVEPRNWTCDSDKTTGGFKCGFDGEIFCRIQKRIRSKHCRQLRGHAKALPRCLRALTPPSADLDSTYDVAVESAGEPSAIGS